MTDEGVPDSFLDEWDTRYERVRQSEENTQYVLVVHPGDGFHERHTQELDIDKRGDLNRDSIYEILRAWAAKHDRPIGSWRIIERATVAKGGLERPQIEDQVDPKLDNIDAFELSEGDVVAFHPAGAESIYGTRTGTVQGATTGTEGLNIRIKTDSGEKQIKPEWVVDVTPEAEKA